MGFSGSTGGMSTDGPPRRLQARKHLPARKAASNGIGSRSNIDFGIAASRSSIREK
jgi:hypothetical protein